MPVSKAKQRAVNKYIAKAYDRVNVVMPKGQKATIQAAAASQGQSVNAYINQAIQSRMGAKRDSEESEIPGYPVSRDVMHMLLRVTAADAGRVMKAANAYFLRGEMPEPPFEGIAKEAFDRIRKDTDEYAAEYRNGTRPLE